MHLSVPADQLPAYVGRQLEAFFPLETLPGAASLSPLLPLVLERMEYCFSRIANKYYVREGRVYFDPLHTDQYAAFLYWLGNTAWREQADPRIAQAAYALNKALHGLDLFYEVGMPDIFFLQHPVGTVLGRATYADYLLVYQRCTIGGNLDMVYPSFGKGVALFSGASVIGDCRLGSNVWVSAGASVMDEAVADDTLVFGQARNLVRKPARRSVRGQFFRTP